MTKARQRERQRRRRAEAQGAVRRGSDSGAGILSSDAVRIVDALFGLLAEKAAAQSGISIEEAIEESWSLLERGCLRLVARDDGHLGVELCESRAEQRVQAGKNRRLVELRRQIAPAAAEPSTVS
jgi:hypothetical protein